MANKDSKAQEPVQDQEAVPVMEPVQTDPRKRIVKIRLQKPMNSKSKGQTVSVNNYRYFIPYGKTVEVPFFIAEIVRQSVEQDERTAAMIESLEEQEGSRA